MVHLLWNPCEEEKKKSVFFFKNVRGMRTGQPWSWHLCLSGYKLEPAKHSKRSAEMAARERRKEGRESPRSRKRRGRGGIIVAVKPGRRESEGVIYSCEWVCCPQGLLWRVSKGKGATKTGLPHLNKRMETETEIGDMIHARKVLWL